jgi:hypothetical protein
MTDLPAGPELDRLVAEKVMGWTDGEFTAWQSDDISIDDDVGYHQFKSSIKYPAYISDGHFYSVIRNIDEWEIFGTDEGPLLHWSPSTNIAHAWEVVEKLRSLGRDVTLHIALGQAACFVRDSDPDRYNTNESALYPGHSSLRSLDFNHHQCYGHAIADTAPLAICRAALQAVEQTGP